MSYQFTVSVIARYSYIKRERVLLTALPLPSDLNAFVNISLSVVIMTRRSVLVRRTPAVTEHHQPSDLTEGSAVLIV